MGNGTINDPYGNYNFIVEIKGIQRAAFHEVTGLDATVAVIEHREGGDNVVRKIPGLTNHSNAQLRWGVAEDQDLADWHEAVKGGAVEKLRQTVHIILRDRTGTKEVARWTLLRAWPTRYAVSDLSAEGSDILIETLELAHEGLTVTKQPRSS